MLQSELAVLKTEGAHITNLSVHLLASLEMYELKRHFIAMARVALAVGPAPLVLVTINSLDRQLVDFTLFLDIHAQRLVCDDIIDV